MITQIRSALVSATGLPVKPLETDVIENCIVYTYYANGDDGAKSSQRLELRLITKSYSEAETYRTEIIQALVPTGDNIKINGILKCELNGGGQLKEYSTQTIHTIMYFDLITKSENN